MPAPRSSGLSRRENSASDHVGELLSYAHDSAIEAKGTDDLVGRLTSELLKEHIDVQLVKPDSETIIADAAQIRQVIGNMLENALEAIEQDTTARGRIRITFEAEQLERNCTRRNLPAGRYICLSI